MSTAASSSSLQADTEALISYLDEAPIRLAVFGEFSAGKTTVLNALIGEEILSVAVEPTTAVPTRVRYGREFNIFIDRVDGERLVLFEDDPPFWTRFVGRRDTLSTLQKQQGTIRDFLRTWTKEGEQASEVERVIIELPLGWLKGGLELVDTPGVNNEFVRHQGFTEQEAGAADVAVLLMDARQGGGKRTEFEFMNDVQQQVERCLVAPNKLDLVPEGERGEFLTYIRETALPKHWDGAVTPPVVGISALAALHPEEYEEPSLVEAFTGLRERLERVAEEERGKLLLARKGNPEKELFGRAKKLEGEEHYGRAHRLYFDLLDVLEAAGLDPTPAEEGIARCEEHLSAQVDALDTLNERYNEAMALAEEDPDAALERLEAIRDEKEDLRLEDGDLDASIEQVRNHIEERDAARTEIQEIKAQVEQHRHDENWIEAAEAAQEILPLIKTAELTQEQVATLQQFVATQEQDRDEWAENRWMEIKDRADACVEDRRYLDAAEHLDDLKMVAPHTPMEEETAAFVEEVGKKAELEGDYRKAIRHAIKEAEVLRNNRVDPEDGNAAESAIETAEEKYRALYGVPDLPTRPPLEKDALPLTIDQKLGLALQIRELAENSPSSDAAEALTGELRKRRMEMQALSLDDRDGLDFVEDYPDHPEAEAALNELLNEQLPFWALPSQIHRTWTAVEEYRDYLPEEEVNTRVRELKKRDAVFQWDKADSPIAVTLLLSGVFFGGVVASTSGALPGFIAGSLLVGGGLLIQYLKPSSDGSKRAKQGDPGQSGESSSGKTFSDKSGSRVATHGVDREARPAGTWQCPNCGNEKEKGEGFKKVMCQKCRMEMQFLRDENKSQGDSPLSGSSSKGVSLPKEAALSCVHEYDSEGVCQKCGWARRALRKINSSQTTRSGAASSRHSSSKGKASMPNEPLKVGAYEKTIRGKRLSIGIISFILIILIIDLLS